MKKELSQNEMEVHVRLRLINNISVTFDGSAQEKVPSSYKVPLGDY